MADGNIFNREYECMSRSEMEALQSERLKNVVKRVYENVAPYRRKMDEIGLKPADIKSVKDLHKLPFTVKKDLRDNYPFGMFAADRGDVVRLHASSGTTGKLTVVGYTKNDLNVWSECMARSLAMAGADKNSVIHVSYGYGLFTGGFGLHYGLEKVGASVVPISSGNTERQLMLMKDFGATALVATPSYAMYLAETAKQKGILKDLKLRTGLFGAEASTAEMHQALRNIFGLFPTENYGLTEITGPGVSGECREKAGMHINEDMFYPEVFDVENNVAKEEGEYGELLLTTLLKEGMPVLRYRTKDITSLNFEPCKCGRTTVRMNRIKGRTDDMLIIRGVNVFPSQIESVLMAEDDIGKHYEIMVDRVNCMDTIEVRVEVADATLLDNYGKLENLRAKLRAKLKSVVQIDINVKLVEPFSLKRTEGKVKRVTDNRHLQD